MKLSQLQYFKAVAEAGRISLAAKKLFISAPALSIAIANLENELGTKLFERTSNRVVLNEQGKVYLECVNQILADLDKAKTTVRKMDGQTDAKKSDCE